VVLANEMTCAAAGRCGVTAVTVASGPAGKRGRPERRRLQLENEQLKLVLAEASRLKTARSPPRSTISGRRHLHYAAGMRRST
jgi:hypothetical protein